MDLTLKAAIIVLNKVFSLKQNRKKTFSSDWAGGEMCTDTK